MARVGTAMVTASAAIFSTAGLLARLIPLDAWTVLLWRGLVGGVVILGCVAVSQKGPVIPTFRRMGWPGLAVAVCSTLGTICFINALQRSTVADVSVIYAAAPFVTAALGWLWTGHREGPVTLLASAAAMLGVLVIFGGAVAPDHVVGNLLALAMTVLIGLMMVIIRNNPKHSMLPAAGLSALASAALAWPLAEAGPPALAELALLALFGLQFGLGLLLLTLGTRRISATRSALIGSLEIPLAPAMVWLALGERPAFETWLGGAIVTAAVLADILFAGRRPSQR